MKRTQNKKIVHVFRQGQTNRNNVQTIQRISLSAKTYFSFCSFHLGSSNPIRRCSAILEAGIISPVSGDSTMVSPVEDVAGFLLRGSYCLWCVCVRERESVCVCVCV